jgi:hypothetical protein
MTMKCERQGDWIARSGLREAALRFGKAGKPGNDNGRELTRPSARRRDIRPSRTGQARTGGWSKISSF